jgi:glucarate dehydratase
MKIQDVRITPIAVTDPPLRNAAGLHAPWALRIVVEIVASNGIVGVSEIPGDVRTEEALRAIAGRIVDTDPYGLNRIASLIDKEASEADSRGEAPWDRRISVHVQSAIEVACLDLIGRETDRPVCDLIGGAVRDRVPFAAYLFFKERGAGGRLGFGTDPEATGWAAARQEAALDPEGIVRQARAMCAEYGFRSIKLKGGALPPETEVDSILALREAFGPEVPLRLDPNAIWSLETGIAMGKRLEGVLEYYEDPVRGQEEMAELGRHVHIPRATNMCTTSFGDLPTSIALASEDIILADHHFWGGLRACVELGRICRVFGRGLSMHSNSHVGISLAAMVHLAAAVPNLTYALDTHYPWQSEEIVTSGRFAFDEGSIAVPKGAGLGIELDREKLAELNAVYRASGLTHRDDQIEMRKIEPGWTFKATRW